MTIDAKHAEVLEFVIGAGDLLGHRWAAGHAAYEKARQLPRSVENWQALLDELQTLWLEEPLRRAG